MKNKNSLVPTDYHDYIYRLFYYLLTPLVPYIPKKIKPNHITVLAFISAMIGTALLVFVKTPVAYLYWVIFNFGWFILDALDGMHARFTRQSSEYGAFLDHALDDIYFIFMLTAFVIKFDLAQVLYIYILMLRLTAALMVFLVQSHTGKLYLSRFSGGFDFLLLTAAVLLSYCYPYLNLAQHTHNLTALFWIDWFDLYQGVFMKLVLLIYFVGVPINIVMQFRFVSKMLNQKRQHRAKK
ncbi:MAG: hypothetical protein COY58_08285 [Gammaproteobacteria bacterium CG_4_10_14_0_8_um_filter_38_16]|nr:MAG: hypothetical protein COY58_08285 [Gammaproteobacteria bacterium CG_4_10_14_0_8_um_filter_38_16]PJA03714.1 MAG: hypothetical protein COX72_03595 [Gammaproteobacteria bacterium CG_4_10_14_0_2_um_filter_38_22]PJB11521.1 MAG: hypothetical protein CO120_00150 [Gammaproteobacteria bacterium CG_4_9_14_3_um_filter_38_9]